MINDFQNSEYLLITYVMHRDVVQVVPIINIYKTFRF